MNRFNSSKKQVNLLFLMYLSVWIDISEKRYQQMNCAEIIPHYIEVILNKISDQTNLLALNAV